MPTITAPCTTGLHDLDDDARAVIARDINHLTDRLGFDLLHHTLNGTTVTITRRGRTDAHYCLDAEDIADILAETTALYGVDEIVVELRDL